MIVFPPLQEKDPVEDGEVKKAASTLAGFIARLKVIVIDVAGEIKAASWFGDTAFTTGASDRVWLWAT
jgi:hypothetical protein